jgi:sugar O-acyltransferase (sialic acid O-acetyltransferase NeuD family)
MSGLVFLGGGGHCRSVVDVARKAGRQLIGVIDRVESESGSVLDCPIIGSDDDICKYIAEAEFIVTVGAIKSAATRIRLYESVKSLGGRLATLISPMACVSDYAIIGDGTVVMHSAVVNAASSIGENCIINTGANIEHDVTVGDHTHVSTGVMVNGGCQIGRGVFIGSGSVLVQGISVADDVVIGAGSVVLRSINTPGTYYGVIK